MDLRIFMGIVVFSLSMNLIGGAFGVGDLEQKTNIDTVRNGTELSDISFSSSCTSDCTTFEAVNNLSNGLGDVWSFITDKFNVIWSFLQLAIPSSTGVLWFDALIFGPIVFALGLGALNYARGK